MLHFDYFYVPWLMIQFIFRAPGIALPEGPVSNVTDNLTAFIQPIGTLCFIHMLPIFLITIRLLRQVPIMAVVTSDAILQIQTGSVIINEFARYIVWFYLGCAFRGAVVRAAKILGRPSRDDPVAEHGRHHDDRHA